MCSPSSPSLSANRALLTLLNILHFLALFPGDFVSSSSPPSYLGADNLIDSMEVEESRDHTTAISQFRFINRRSLMNCPDPNKHLQIEISPNSSLSDEQNVTVTITGVLWPSKFDWVAMISPSYSE